MSHDVSKSQIDENPLHLFQYKLCLHATTNICKYLRPSFSDASTADLCRNNLREHLDPGLADFVEKCIFQLADWFFDHFGFVLNGHEFAQLHNLASVLRDGEKGEQSLRHLLTWLPDPSLYDEFVNCVEPIKTALTQKVAEAWCQRSKRYWKKLRDDRMGLAEGIFIVSQWSDVISKYLEATGRIDLVPQPRGQHPTPTSESGEGPPTNRTSLFLAALDEIAKSSEAKRNTRYVAKMYDALELATTREEIECLADHPYIREYVGSMRKAVQGGKTKCVKTILKECRETNAKTKHGPKPFRTNSQLCKLALRILHRLGQYNGFKQDKASREKRGTLAIDEQKGQGRSR
jgi:hypothetical protein